MAIIEDQELLQMFLEESREHLDGIESDFLKIEEMGEEIDSDLVNNVFRAIHSVKGGAGFLGLETIKNLAHSMENVLNLIRNGELVPTPEIVSVLLSSLDLLKELVQDYESSNDVDIGDHLAALEKAAAGEASASQEAPSAEAESPDPPSQESPSPEEGPNPSTEPLKAGDEETTLVLPGGKEALVVSTAALRSAVEQGKRLYLCEFDWEGDLDRKGKTPQDLLEVSAKAGEVLSSGVSCADIPGLEDQVGGPKVPFFILLACGEDVSSLKETFGLPEEKIFTVTPEGAVSPCEPAASGPAEEPAKAKVEEPPEKPAKAPESNRIPEVPPKPTPPKDQKSSEKKQASPPPSSQGAKKKSETKKPPSKLKSLSPHNNTLRVHVDLLDKLMNLAGELVLTRNQLLQNFLNEDEVALGNAVQRVDLITSELQEAIMSTRMQPVGIVFNKFQRVVHDLSKSLGKQVKLVTHGEDVELDKTIIEAIGDPLTHLVRNAVDHGIEPTEVREQAGKPLPALVKLSAKHQAGQVVIQVEDDGRGIDPEKVRAKAWEMKLEDKEKLDAMPDNEVIRFIFKPGFSTAQTVTDVSGRGVGMDVVFSNLSKLGGSIDLHSKVGEGTRITIKLPLTLAIIPSLIVKVGSSRYAIPQVGLVELVRIPPAQIKERIGRIDDAALLRLRGEILPLIRVADILETKTMVSLPHGEEIVERRKTLFDRRTPNFHEEERRDPPGEDRRKGERRKDSGKACNIAIVNAGELHFGLVVDELLDSEEIVVKPLGRHLRGINTYAGATILGDGKAALILDVGGIANAANLKAVKDKVRERALDNKISNIQDAQSFLLVKNAEDEHFAVPLGLISRLEKIHKDQIERTSGKQTIMYQGGTLVLCSIEEVANVKPRADVDHPYVLIFPFAGKELGILVSEILDVVECANDIDEESFRQPGILGSTIIDDKTTLLLDLYGIASNLFPEWVEEKTQTQRGGQTETATLLLVEDSKFFLNQVKGFTKDAGYEVKTALDGVQALEILNDPETRIDLVLTDIEMPNMDGIELARRIRGHSRYSRLPIIALTSVASEETKSLAMEAGMDEYLIKLDRDNVLERIAYHLSGRSRQG